MSLQQPLILVIGCGSIDERHVRTILATGRAKVKACDNQLNIRRYITERYGIQAIVNWSSELGNALVTAAIIATPAPSHVGIVRRCLQAGWHVLIEKLFSISMYGMDQLRAAQHQAQRFTSIAYVLHFAQALQDSRRFIQSGAVGAIKHVVVNSGNNFPIDRPAYREICYRDHAQGGGAIQDALTHMANAVEWIAGPTTRIYCDAAYQVLDGVTVEDTVNACARN